MYYICVAKIKALNNCTVTLQLVCALNLFLQFKKSRLPHDAANILYSVWKLD